MKFEKISKIILFGGSPALLEFAQIASSLKKQIYVFSSKRHLEEKLPVAGKSLKICLKKHSTHIWETQNINRNKILNKLVDETTMGIAFGASWVFGRQTVNLFKSNYLIDFMGIDLPRYRGGAHYTWQVLQSNSQSVFNMQIILGGIDSLHLGPVIFRKKYRNSNHLAKPKDYFSVNSDHHKDFFRAFLMAIEKGVIFNIKDIDESKSSYFPFLSTANNAYINWSWSGSDICKFINAFDEPYSGAKTFIGKKKLVLRGCTSLSAEAKYHPFTSGIVVRKDEVSLYVASVGSLLKISGVFDDKNRPYKVGLGDRFYTPHDILDNSMQFRAVYDSHGLKT